ncbi:hypothetical protein [Natronococcus occultus]|uniref:Uncharacterized protein n=1 Tax=Natronococcus occultus SP4 TaxID=694430 RepID=L0JUV1_9EURY|nr:hypothetical protein [Natronococcus occultus]AGB36546.1 hypothetical protein Natoc_0686 [Natronococcus occultus SP4]
MVAPFARTVVGWTLVAFLSISVIELLLFGRLEPIRYLPGAIGGGIGLTAADRLVGVSLPRV